MKKYIFMTTSTKNAGGIQCYLAAKAKYLESFGWQVFVFCSAPRPKSVLCPIDSLNKYLKDGNIAILGVPPFMVPGFLVRSTINTMVSRLGAVNPNEEHIVESHMDIDSQWGELLASRIGARHYNYMMPENYRGDKYYEDKIDFYKFKFARKELLGSKDIFSRLFDGYMTVSEADFPGAVVLDECPIQDVRNEKVDNLKKEDWTICYIGRGNKPYVSQIISDVAKFALIHKNKIIQMIFITDDFGQHEDLLRRSVEKSNNLKFNNLGMMHPIPSSLFKKIDVVIAGSGSARHSCEEGAIVIVADPESKKSLGVLGYETMNSMYRSDDSVLSDYCDALTRVLVDKVYLNMENKWPKKLGVEKCTEQNFWLFSQSERKKEYYNRDKLLEGKVNIIKILKCYIAYYFPCILKFTNKMRF